MILNKKFQFFYNNGKYNFTTFTCDCDESFYGINCEFKICPYDCNKNGECDKNTGKCKCSSDFSGLDCSISKII